MATEGPNQATAVVEFDDGWKPWTNAGNAITDDNSYATCFCGDGEGNGGYTNYLDFTGFSFAGAIANGDSITSVTVELACKTDAGTATFDNVQLIVGGSVVGSSVGAGNGISSTESYVSTGAKTVVGDFGTTLSGSQAKASNFGVRIQCRSTVDRTISVDAVRVTLTGTFTGGGGGGTPTVPLSASATNNGTTGIALAWSTPSSDGGSSITAYKVYRGTVSGSLSLYQTLGVVTSYTDTGATLGTTYYYKISAVNGTGEGTQTSELNATYLTRPTAPQSPSASADSNSITISWLAPSSNGGASVTAYTLYRGLTSGGGISFYQSLGNVLSYDDTSVTPGTTYYYKVTATNSQGEGSASSEVNGVVLVASKKHNIMLLGIGG